MSVANQWICRYSRQHFVSQCSQEKWACIRAFLPHVAYLLSGSELKGRVLHPVWDDANSDVLFALNLAEFRCRDASALLTQIARDHRPNKQMPERRRELNTDRRFLISPRWSRLISPQSCQTTSSGDISDYIKEMLARVAGLNGETTPLMSERWAVIVQHAPESGTRFQQLFIFIGEGHRYKRQAMFSCFSRSSTLFSFSLRFYHTLMENACNKLKEWFFHCRYSLYIKK